MKRSKTSTSKHAAGKTRSLDARHLTTVHGGLGIAVEVIPPPPQFMQQQHNETLISVKNHRKGGTP